MTTSITPQMLLAALREWGIPYAPYIPSGGDASSWLTHNRNKAGLNAGATPGGWGPLRGVIDHNTAMTASQAAQLAYLWRGDGEGSNKPGPLCQFALGKDGKVWLMGWGAATHAGPGDAKVEARFRANNAPLDREMVPTTNISSPTGTTMINPFYFGIEQMHAGEGPTDIQRATNARLIACLLDLLGGPAKGYGAGSAGAHRELTTTRSDPEGVVKDGALRRSVAAALAKGPTQAPVVTPTKTATTTTVRVDPDPSLRLSSVQVVFATVPAVPGKTSFEYLVGGVWRPFAAPIAGPSGSFEWRFGGTHPIRARFVPTDTAKYAGNASAPVMVTTYTLQSLLDRLEKLENPPAPTTQAVPVTAFASLGEPPVEVERTMEGLLIEAEWDALHPEDGHENTDEGASAATDTEGTDV